MKFKPGDKVLLKEKFYRDRYQDDPGVADVMMQLEGNVFEIAGLYDGHEEQTEPSYRVKENTWIWGERWLEYYDETEIKEISDDELTELLFCKEE